MKLCFVGAGNLATRIALEMRRIGLEIGQIYSRTQESAERLAGQVGCRWTTDLTAIETDADIYVFSLKDQALEDVVARMRPNRGIWIHTAGSMPMSLFSGRASHYGVVYPLQTFSKERKVAFEHIPFFIEGDAPETERLLSELVSRISNNVHLLSSKKRKTLHLAAVFACNFSNHMYALAARILKEDGLDCNWLLPLIDETAAKVHEMSPLEAQTGPAVRFDENVMNNHLAMLSDPDLKALYRQLSRSIYKESNNHE